MGSPGQGPGRDWENFLNPLTTTLNKNNTDDSNEEGTEHVSVVVRSRVGWRKQMVKWQEELQEEEEDGKGKDSEPDKSGDDEILCTPATHLHGFPLALGNSLLANLSDRSVSWLVSPKWFLRKPSTWSPLLQITVTKDPMLGLWRALV